MNALQINPVVNAGHYAYYFNCHINTARKYLNTDKDALNKRRLTFQDFYALYNGFPCSKFKPKWLDIDTPQQLKKAS